MTHSASRGTWQFTWLTVLLEAHGRARNIVIFLTGLITNQISSVSTALSTATHMLTTLHVVAVAREELGRRQSDRETSGDPCVKVVRPTMILRRQAKPSLVHLSLHRGWSRRDLWTVYTTNPLHAEGLGDERWSQPIQYTPTSFTIHMPLYTPSENRNQATYDPFREGNRNQVTNRNQATDPFRKQEPGNRNQVTNRNQATDPFREQEPGH